MRLTKAILDGFKIPEKRQVFLWDSETPGFGVRVSPGGTITFVAQGRIRGTTRRVSLGKYGILTVQQARVMAQSELLKMIKGVDPVKEKIKQDVYGKTLREISADYLLDRKNLKESSRQDILRHVKTSFHDWADRPAIDITRDKVGVRFAELSEKSPAQANQGFRVLRALLNYARGKYRPSGKPLFVENPVSVLSDTRVWNHIKPRSNRIPLDRIGACWSLLQATRSNPFEKEINHTAADAASFPLLTRCRWS
ncbi:MAG: DUF4102 domain-containing protein, partial [Deltaproteobacteria bacterium]|nr:DUF4102 domain-containing protein [Deltaproteobacteria bacterium]